MTVYVDGITDYGDVARKQGLRSTKWAHLTADTPEELHTFAADLGLKRAWFQLGDTYRWHYDVTPAKRTAALKAGAVSIDRRQLAEIMRTRRTPLPEPIFGAAGGWKDVMTAAGGCCQCTGQCGTKHAKTGGRCDTAHGGYAGKGLCHPIRLEVGPIDVTLSEHAAARLTPDQLMAWCPKCHAAAIRAARPPQTRKTVPQDDALFPDDAL